MMSESLFHKLNSPSLETISIENTDLLCSLSGKQLMQTQSKPPSRKLYKLQLRLLLWSSGISLVLFLFLFLNAYEFIALLTFGLSTMMLFHTAWQYLNFLISNGALFLMIPEPAKDYILKTSLHDILIVMKNHLYCRKKHTNNSKVLNRPIQLK